MNEDEKELLDLPESNETSIEDDPFGDVELDDIQEEGEESEESTPANETDDNPTEVDYSPFFKEISEKAKYNKESVQVDSMDDVINNFQKGLNYDKIVDKLNNLENSKVFSYVSKKANELGMTVDEYMDSVEKYEKEQEEARQQQKIDEMISNGVPEEVAREVVATSQLRKELQEEKNKLEKERQSKADKDKKDQEYAEFLESFPEVKAEDIPKEVFLNAQKSNLKQAYLEWQNAELKKQLEINKTNEKNKSSSVGSTTEYGGVVNEKTDPFLEGFDSV